MRHFPGWSNASLLMLCLALAASANAQTLPPPESVVVSLFVNTVPAGDAFIVRRGGQVFVRPKDLERGGMTAPALAPAQVKVDGTRYVALGRLSRATWRFDERKVSLSLTVPPWMLRATVVSLRQHLRPPNLDTQEAPGAFVNYAFEFQGYNPEAAAEIGLTAKRALLYSGVTATPKGVVRGLTQLVYDDPKRLVRVVVGDLMTNGGPLGGGGVVAGVHVVREFSLDPSFIQYPALRVSGETALPSELDVSLNDALVRQISVPPGPFTVDDLPLPSGLGTANLVLRDPFGRVEQIAGRTFYRSTDLLARGVHEFAYSVGYLRERYGQSSFDYTVPVIVARHRVGLTDWLTLGARLEASSHLLSTGVFGSAVVGFGEVSLALAGSRAHGDNGDAAFLSFGTLSRRVSASAYARAMSAHYASTGMLPTDDRPVAELGGSVGFSFNSSTSVNLQAAYLDDRDDGPGSRVTLGGQYRWSSRVGLSATLFRLAPAHGETTYEGLLTATVNLAPTTDASVWVDGTPASGSVGVDVDAPVTGHTGLGYRLRGSLGNGFDGIAAVEDRGPAGRYDAGVEVIRGHAVPTGAVTGALVATGGHVFATEPIDQSYALVRAPGLSGVRVRLNHQVVGRTSSNGELLVTGLLPYDVNRLSLDEQDLPDDVTLDRLSLAVSPAMQAGVVAGFGVRRLHVLRGRLVVIRGGKPLSSAYGELSVAGAPSSPLGQNGEFEIELDSAGPATLAASAIFADGTCRFTLRVPASTAPILDLGDVRCEATGEAP